MQTRPTQHTDHVQHQVSQETWKMSFIWRGRKGGISMRQWMKEDTINMALHRDSKQDLINISSTITFNGIPIHHCHCYTINLNATITLLCQF